MGKKIRSKIKVQINRYCQFRLDNGCVTHVFVPGGLFWVIQHISSELIFLCPKNIFQHKSLVELLPKQA